MEHYVSFKTDRFDSTTVKPHFINPETGFGEDAIVWIKNSVQHLDVTLDSPIQEDYGWGVWASVRGVHYWIATSLVDKGNAHHLPEWGITIAYERGCNLLRRVPSARHDDLRLLSQAVDRALHADPAITEIQWRQKGFNQDQPSDHPK